MRGTLLWWLRFDKLIYLSVSEDDDSQLKIMQALTRKYVVRHSGLGLILALTTGGRSCATRRAQVSAGPGI